MNSAKRPAVQTDVDTDESDLAAIEAERLEHCFSEGVAQIVMRTNDPYEPRWLGDGGLGV